ncbi:MAG: response regulator [Pseudomonadales bacterium]
MKKILIIDDDNDFNESLKDYLEYEDFEVVCAFDGKQGLSLVYQEEPDLIITDIIMPELEGIEFLQKIADNPPAFPAKIIAISGGGRIDGAKYLVVAQGLGADYIFEKPLDIEKLIEVIRKLLH